MKISVIALKDDALDYAVAVAQKLPVQFDPMGFNMIKNPGGYWVMGQNNGKETPSCKHQIGTGYSPSKNWQQGGEIINILLRQG